MRVKLIADQETLDLARWPDGIIPAGTSIDDPHGHLLIELGIAEPDGGLADDYVRAKMARDAAIAQRNTAKQDSDVARQAVRELEVQKRRLAEFERQDALAAALGVTVAETDVAAPDTDTIEDEDEL